MASCADMAALKKTPKFSTRQHNRCRRCGRSRGYYRLFELCRICVRQLGAQGQIPGLRKASW